jgi:hypothetical protein
VIDLARVDLARGVPARLTFDEGADVVFNAVVD